MTVQLVDDMCNQCFVDDIDVIAGTEAKLQHLTTKQETVSQSYGVEINME